MQGYMTRYALSTGIKKVTVEKSTSPVATKQYVYTTDRPPIQLIVGVDFFFAKEQAESRARAMAKSKVVSLNKSLTKMKTLAKEPKWER